MGAPPPVKQVAPMTKQVLSCSLAHPGAFSFVVPSTYPAVSGEWREPRKVGVARAASPTAQWSEADAA